MLYPSSKGRNLQNAYICTNCFCINSTTIDSIDFQILSIQARSSCSDSYAHITLIMSLSKVITTTSNAHVHRMNISIRISQILSTNKSIAKAIAINKAYCPYI